MVFPTRVGVNRLSRPGLLLSRVFPTRVGVNRTGATVLNDPLAFSPPAWG